MNRVFDRIGSGEIHIEHNQSGSVVKAPYILKRDENGAVMWRPGTAPLLTPQQRTDAFSYEHIPPEIEVPLGFQTWIGGAGFEEVSSSDLNALSVYNYTQGIDLSWGERGYLSPELQTGGTVTTTFPKKFLFSESLGLFSINDRFVSQWTGSAWTERLDAGVGAVLEDLVEYTNSIATYLVLGLQSDAFYHSTDGINWIQDTVGSIPIFRSTATANATSTSITPSEPAGATENDVLIMHIVCDGLRVISPNDGAVWTQIEQFGMGGGQFALFWSRRGSGAPDYQFNSSGTDELLANVTAYSGCATTGNPTDQSDPNDSTGSTSHVVGPIILTGQNRLLLTFYSVEGANSNWTPPAGATERYDVDGTLVSSAGNDEGQAAAGSTGIQTATASNGTPDYGAVLVALRATGSTSGGAEDLVRLGVRGQLNGEMLLWGIDSKGDIRNTPDPTDGTSWSSADDTQLGQDDKTLIGMEVVDNTFYIFRDTEIISYDGLTISTVYSSPTFKLATDAARPFLWVDGHIYFTYNHRLFQFDATNNKITPIWPAPLGNTELNGTITAIAGDENHLYFAVKNIAGNSYIMKGDPRRPITVGTGIVHPFHTWAYRGTGDALALLVVPADSDAMSSTNPHLVLGDDASADYFILPRAGFRPEDDGNYKFDTTTDRIVYGSFVDWGASAFTKFLNRGAITGDDIDSDDTVTLQYQLPGGSATTIVTAAAVSTADRYESVLTAEVEFTTLRYVGLLNNGAAGTTPILEGFALHATLNPPRKRIWNFTVDLPPKGNDQDGRFLASHLFNALNERVTLYDMEGNNFLVRILDIQGAGATIENEGLHQALDVLAVQI